MSLKKYPDLFLVLYKIYVREKYSSSSGNIQNDELNNGSSVGVRK